MLFSSFDADINIEGWEDNGDGPQRVNRIVLLAAIFRHEFTREICIDRKATCAFILAKCESGGYNRFYITRQLK